MQSSFIVVSAWIFWNPTILTSFGIDRAPGRPFQSSQLLFSLASHSDPSFLRMLLPFLCPALPTPHTAELLVSGINVRLLFLFFKNSNSLPFPSNVLSPKAPSTFPSPSTSLKDTKTLRSSPPRSLPFFEIHLVSCSVFLEESPRS